MPPIPFSCSCGTAPVIPPPSQTYSYSIYPSIHPDRSISHGRDAASGALFCFSVLLKDTSGLLGRNLTDAGAAAAPLDHLGCVKLLILLSVWFQCWPSISQVVPLLLVPGPTWSHLVPPGPTCVFCQIRLKICLYSWNTPVLAQHVSLQWCEQVSVRRWMQT